MEKLASTDVIMMDMMIYWILSIVLFQIMDFFAKKKLGGKNHEGYKVLRIPKFLAMSFVSLYAMGMLIYCFIKKDFTVSAQTLTFLGVPFYTAWVFFLINMLRRLRAEKNGRK
ncbi:MAG: hypothetical protein LBU41_01885 [Clostridiales Family XIII bacterium]|jgi:drug/metabolite transporter (DMT)-like permease|nr:hypothetical protein [Clostridiales Family XIII bacterium]